ncbi:MAG: ATP-dependent helicase [Candidatus Kapabacteria bacterium]|nr:ATP-dependent helicase [Candidatus Kapabacteria bacterium]
MKKIVLKKFVAEPRARIGYKIPYEAALNAAQYEAVMHNEGAALVVAGAGTGKTRTLIYRVARLIEDGTAPEQILLLTFTRKSASEMLRRASALLDGRCEKVSGGTFHSFSLQTLRTYAAHINYDPSFNVLDQSDAEDTVNLIRSQYKFEKSKKRFPQKSTLIKILSLSINKRDTVEKIIEDNFPLFSDETQNITNILLQYDIYKKKYGLMDYDDLLLNLLNLLKTSVSARRDINKRLPFVMVDEYQDTNRLQHEIVMQLAGEKQNIMAVGDDAQSIYAFRGADFQNILFFPESFTDCKVYKIEQNYRSNQPILNLTNSLINKALFKYEKELFTDRDGGELPKLVAANDERQQSEFITQQILELREQGIELNEIAVLFRSGFLAFDVEIELNKSNIPYRKFGGIKFIETAHVKDLIAYLRILFNPRDAVSWQRILLLLDGVGQRTASDIIEKLSTGVLIVSDLKNIDLKGKKQESIQELFQFLSEISNSKQGVGDKASAIAEFYKPLLKKRYDDWQKRWKDIEMFLNIAERYKSLRDFLNDMAIDPPVEAVSDLESESKEDEYLTLSTIHSAKGLEWKVVFLIWALEGRFPSAKSVDSIESLEEERRLFYVACTRAKDELYISYPMNFYDRESGFVLSEPSRFIDDIEKDLYEKYILVEEE